MKIIIALGMVIIFISAFFILFIFDTVIRDQVRCMAGFEHSSCDIKQASFTMIMGLGLIALFLVIDTAVLYIIIKSITTSGSAYIAYSV